MKIRYRPIWSMPADMRAAWLDSPATDVVLPYTTALVHVPRTPRERERASLRALLDALGIGRAPAPPTAHGLLDPFLSRTDRLTFPGCSARLRTRPPIRLRKGVNSMVDDPKSDDGAAALAEALRDAPEVQLDALRRTVRLVLQMQCAELEEFADNRWPPFYPSAMLRSLVADDNEQLRLFVENVTQRLFTRVRIGGLLQ